MTTPRISDVGWTLLRARQRYPDLRRLRRSFQYQRIRLHLAHRILLPAHTRPCHRRIIPRPDPHRIKMIQILPRSHSIFRNVSAGVVAFHENDQFIPVDSL